ncbi:unnamed protein product [Allacma fusca]|uniref:Uncharacterized protein n=1 Tax=Allacma fusca TaxID=39272 RepID=A0A8J2KKD1_9HEXA|nr:unnamed protein product [Allacma fusca]
MKPEIVSVITAFDFGLLSEDPVEFKILKGNDTSSGRKTTQSDQNGMKSSMTFAFRNGERGSTNNCSGAPSSGTKSDATYGLATGGEFEDLIDGLRPSKSPDDDIVACSVSDLMHGQTEKSESLHSGKEVAAEETEVQSKIHSDQTNTTQEVEIPETQSSLQYTVNNTELRGNSNNCSEISGLKLETVQNSTVPPTRCNQLSFDKKQEVFTAKTITSTGIKWESYSEIQNYVIDDKLLLPPRINKVVRSNMPKRKKSRK